MSAPNPFADGRREGFLGAIPDDLKSQVANGVLASADAGEDAPDAIYQDAIAQLRGRLAGRGAGDAGVRAILGLLLRHRVEAIAYCAWCLDWERLSPAEKARLKAARGEEYRQAYQEAEPPTEKQCAYLRRLGYQAEPRSKRHASELIDQLVKGRAA